MVVNQFLKILILKILTVVGLSTLIPSATFAQITPANDGTGTQVTPSQNRFDIQGGSRSQDGSNLFHSFEQFNLDTGETANFIASPETRNILTRIVGGNLSIIDGQIQVTGSNANLFLMNPAGIIFGSNASLNVPASFFATTSTAIGFGEMGNGVPQSWFEAFQANDYSQLNGSPRAFFVSNAESGVIINAGNLTVEPGNTIGLVSSIALNRGTISAPEGNISLESVPNGGLVRITQAGSLLSLEVQSQRLEPFGTPITSLPKILTGGTQDHATNVIVNEDNTITLTNRNQRSLRERRSRSNLNRFQNFSPSEIIAFSSELSVETVIPLDEVPIPVPALALENTVNPIPQRFFGSIQNFDISKVENLNNLNGNEIHNIEVMVPSMFLGRNQVIEIEPFSVSPSVPVLGNSINLEDYPNSQSFPTPIPAQLSSKNSDFIFSEPRLTAVNPEEIVSRIQAENLIHLDSEQSHYSIIDRPVLENTISSSLNPENSQALASAPVLTETNIKEVLGEIEAKTTQKPAVIYITAHPNNLVEQVEGLELQTQDGLNLMLVLPNGKTIVKSIPDINLRQLNRLAREFYGEINDPQTTAWPAARKLYDLFISPLELDLKEAGIDTLLFCLDEELRSLPLAALHDGKQFLIEKYNFSLIPSLNLTNVSYQGLQDAEVLAMGMSEFEDQPALPGVPTEVKTITQEIWQGEALLNQDFTLENLQKKRNQKSFEIIHLATHANFNSQQDSYIQFWDDKLSLDQLRELQWYKQPQVELLVLSACRTALGNNQEAETEMGFAGLAYRAGVKSALASLWRVSDLGTLGLMVEFYEQLKSSPIKAEALRKAQLALLRGEVRMEGDSLQQTLRSTSLPTPLTLTQSTSTQDFSHPYYWAGFTMIGSPW
ncbi:MAG: CHAT domain-containing protein [Cyanobacteria bacterium J06592_8]